MPRSGMPTHSRAAAELVAELVDALLEQQDRERGTALLARAGQQARALGIVPVGAQEGGADPARPEHRPALEQWRVLPRRHAARPQALECGVGRVVEGAHHAGDVAQRRALQPPLRERAGWLALEVGDEEVVAGAQDLAEVEVAVAADAHAAQPAADDPATSLEDAGLGAAGAGRRRPAICSGSERCRSRNVRNTCPTRLRNDW